MKKIILITGASRGIGAATAIKAGKLGYTVCINYAHNKAKAQEVADHITHDGGHAFIVQADVASTAGVNTLFQAIDQQKGQLVALVNNAGIVAPTARVDQMDEARLTQMFQVNVISQFLCAKQAILRMSTKHGGHGGVIINVSSAAARIGSGGDFVDYAASKGAIDTFTLGLANEVAREGIRVNCVRPGFVATDIHRDSGDPARLEKVAASIPMQRAGTPEEIANTIMWLISDEASYITRSFIDVTGGR